MVEPSKNNCPFTCEELQEMTGCSKEACLAFLEYSYYSNCSLDGIYKDYEVLQRAIAKRSEEITTLSKDSERAIYLQNYVKEMTHHSQQCIKCLKNRIENPLKCVYCGRV